MHAVLVTVHAAQQQQRKSFCSNSKRRLNGAGSIPVCFSNKEDDCQLFTAPMFFHN